MKKLWTGKTARQELFGCVTINASVNDFSINDALESVLDGGERAPDGSMKREMLRWWDGSSCEAQSRFLSEARRYARQQDRLMGRRVAR